MVISPSLIPGKAWRTTNKSSFTRVTLGTRFVWWARSAGSPAARPNRQNRSPPIMPTDTEGFPLVGACRLGDVLRYSTLHICIWGGT